MMYLMDCEVKNNFLVIFYKHQDEIGLNIFRFLPQKGLKFRRYHDLYYSWIHPSAYSTY